MVKFSERPLKLIATASSLPGPPVTNTQLLEALRQHIGKSHNDVDNIIRRAKAIARRLAIYQRHLTRRLDVAVSKPTVSAPEMGVTILSRMLDNSSLESEAIDYLITHTATPHTQIPGNSAWIADRAGLACPHMELRQACTGFANALFIASGLLATTDDIKTIAISGMEVGSVFFEISPAFLDDEQLLNYMQMGDGAGGALVTACEPGTDDRGVISDIYHGHIGNGRAPGFHLAGGGSSDIANEPGAIPRFRHTGETVKRFGTAIFIAAIQCIADRGHKLEEFDWIIPHQASGRIGQLLSNHTKIAVDRFVVDTATHGNLGSAAIWVSLDKLIRSGKLSRGQRVLVLGAEATKYMYGGFIYRH